MPSTTFSSSVVGRPDRCVVDDLARYSMVRAVDMLSRRYFTDGAGGLDLPGYYRDILNEAVVLSCPCAVHRAMPLPTEKVKVAGEDSERERCTVITPPRRAAIRAALERLDAALAVDRARFADPRNGYELSPDARRAESALIQVLAGVIAERPRHDAAGSPSGARPVRTLLGLGLDPDAATMAGVLLDSVYGRHYRVAALFGAPHGDPRELALFAQDSLRQRCEAAQRRKRSHVPSEVVLRLQVMDLYDAAELIDRARGDIRRIDPAMWSEIESDCRAAQVTSLEAMQFTEDGHRLDLDPTAASVTMPRTVTTSAAALEPDRIHFASIVDAGTGRDEPYRAMFTMIARHLEAGTPEVVDWAHQWVTAGGTRADDTLFAHWLRGRCTKRALGESKSAIIIRTAANDPDHETLRSIVSCTRALMITLDLETTLYRITRRHHP